MADIVEKIAIGSGIGMVLWIGIGLVIFDPSVERIESMLWYLGVFVLLSVIFAISERRLK